MKLLFDDEAKTHCIVLDKKEAQDLCTALQYVTGEWDGPPPRKNSRVFKIAEAISNDCGCW